MSTQVEDEDDMGIEDWTELGKDEDEVVSGRGWKFGWNAKLETGDSRSSDEGSAVVRKKIVREEFKIILKFRKEDENMQLSPSAVSRELKKKMSKGMSNKQES